MDDTIYRQAAIDAIGKDIMGGLNYESILRDMPPAQQWIPCSERYPDMDETVLVYTGANDYHVWDCMSNRADNYFWEDEDGLYHDKYEVDAWMPLPEPYKGER